MTEKWSSSVDVHLDWAPGSGRQGLAKAVRTAIRDGRWRPGTIVPSTRALAHDLGIARGTVTRVYSDLAAEGYLQTRAWSTRSSPHWTTVARCRRCSTSWCSPT